MAQSGESKTNIDAPQSIFHDDDAWRNAGRREFEATYSDDDSVYELLIHDTQSR